MGRFLKALDESSARIERAVVLGLLTVMAATVFLDVVHRVASTPEGLLLRLLTALAGGDPSDSTRHALRTVGVPSASALAAWLFFYGALRTATRSRLTGARAALAATGLTAATGFALWLLLTLFPNGLVWSQPLALGLLLWVALLGATLAAKERGHIVLEVADKLWPERLLPLARLLSGLIAAAFCFVGVLLGAHYVSDFVAQWQEGVGYVSGVPMPKWVVYAAIPASFLLMGLRFLAYTIGDFLKRDDAAAAGAQ